MSDDTSWQSNEAHHSRQHPSSDQRSDISHLLKNWKYDPSGVTARTIKGVDGRRKIQMRLDLGVFQMEISGRPDGTRPREFDSLLDYYRFLQNTSAKKLNLSDDDCSELQQEAVQFYYRYLACFAIKDYESVVRDTRHNLGILEFITEHTTEAAAWEFLQFKPYVLMMESRALAEKAALGENYHEAIEEVQRGLKTIRNFWQEQGELELRESSYEIDVLSELLQSLKDRKPTREVGKLKERLHHAISTEDFEQAAQIRDQLAAME